MVRSKIDSLGGVPTLFVEDRPLPGVAYITYFTSNNRYADFAGAGFRLFSMPVFFGAQTINEVSQFPPFMDGIYDHGIHYDIFDREIRRILDACPDAMIFPRVNCSLPREWEDAHPDELCDTCRRSSFSSDLWFEETRRLLTDFIRHVQAADYADHIIGYQIAGGNTEEWFPFDMQGSVGAPARKKYAALTGKFYEKGEDFSCDSDFYDFLAKTIANRIDQLASHLKELVNGQQVVGAFYGYTLECPWRHTAHLALGELLKSENVDFICSPTSYMGTRAFGIDHPCMLPLDSLKLHGKLYFVENDTRTDLSRPPNDQPHYNQPIWYGPDRQTSLEIIKQHFCRALLHGHAQWWFDMWGGWYDDPEYMELMRKTLAIAEDSLGLSRKSAARVAVFLDEKAMLLVDAMDEVYHFRRALGLMGAAYDIYLVTDYPAVSQNYSFCIFMEPAKTEAMTRAIESCDLPYLVITSENCKITSAELRAHLKQNAIPLRSEDDAVVYESEGHLFIGGNKSPLCYEGEATLLLNGIGRLYRKL
ncbi:MAG: hypothetical protein IKZ21_08000 [Clostridia bacterium]|nr:hypothetical protein [Clostridia bacterium]